MKRIVFLTLLLFTLFGCSNQNAVIVGDLAKFDLYGPVKTATHVIDEDYTIESEFDASGVRIELSDLAKKEYDKLGRLSHEEDETGDYTFEYDRNNRIVKMIETDWDNNQRIYVFKFDKNGTAIKQQNPDGSYILFSEHVLDQFNNWTQRKYRILRDETVVEEGMEKREIDYYPQP